MAFNAKVQIGLSDDFLEGVAVSTPAGAGLFREGVVVSDDTEPEARARVLDRAPVATDFGMTVRQVGPVQVSNFPAVQTNALTDAELRAAPVATQDDYALGEVLDDQLGANNVLTFTFSQPVVSFWVAVQGDMGVVKVDHYGGTPSLNRGIPVGAGGVLPIPEPASVVRVFAPTGLTVTVWGQRRA